MNSRIGRMAQAQIIKEVVILPEFAFAKDYWREQTERRRMILTDAAMTGETLQVYSWRQIS